MTQAGMPTNMDKGRKRSPKYILGDVITSAFFAGVTFMFGLVFIVLAIDSIPQHLLTIKGQGVLFIVSIVCFTASFTTIRISITKARSMYK